MTEKTTADILQFLGHNVSKEIVTAPINDDKQYQEIEIRHQCTGYQDIFPMANLLHHSFAYEIYQEQHNHNPLFTEKVDFLFKGHGETILKNLENALIDMDINSENENYPDYAIQAYAQCYEICIKKLELTQIPSCQTINFSEYLNLMSESYQQGCFLVDHNENKFSLSDLLYQQKEIEWFYNHNTESTQDVVGFLAVMHALKTNEEFLNIDLQAKDIQYESLQEGDETKVKFTINNSEYSISVIEDTEKGIVQSRDLEICKENIKDDIEL